MKKIRFSENLKSLRESAGLTQEKLAQEIGVNQRTISAWERGICEPNFQYLALLCDLFNETFENILS